MAITINGTGSITGLTAGGLPDGSVTADDLAADAVTSAKIANGTIVDADVNASAAIADSKLTGTTCKAWVNFNGTGTVAIRASYNVSSVTDNGVGNYTINFTEALADANYSASITGNATPIGGLAFVRHVTFNSTGHQVYFFGNYPSGAASASDNANVTVSVFR
jgi:hypothetical protein